MLTAQSEVHGSQVATELHIDGEYDAEDIAAIAGSIGGLLAQKIVDHFSTQDEPITIKDARSRIWDYMLAFETDAEVIRTTTKHEAKKK